MSSIKIVVVVFTTVTISKSTKILNIDVTSHSCFPFSSLSLSAWSRNSALPVHLEEIFATGLLPRPGQDIQDHPAQPLSLLQGFSHQGKD
jgi:hypothetical protein